MEHEVKPRGIRFLYGTHAECEFEVNRVSSEYTITNIAYHLLREVVMMSVVLVHHSELRKAQLANIQPTQTRRN